jgi:uncharacterized protein YndB with AHSA1/START domain
MASESRHIAVHVDRPVAEVYAYTSDPSHLPDWAPGLCTSIDQVGDHWVAESAMGSIIVRYAEPNPYGVIDHEVVLESGETIHNPVRVLPHDDGAEVVFTLRRQDGMSDADFERDAETVLADLVALKGIVETSTT